MAIDVNTASREELISLGLRRSIAEALIEARPFRSIDELLSVPGIGPRSADRLKSQGLAVISGSEASQDTAQTEGAEADTCTAENVSGLRPTVAEGTDELSEGSMGRAEEVAPLQRIYVEAPRGVAVAAQEVEGFDDESITEYQRRRGTP